MKAEIEYAKLEQKKRGIAEMNASRLEKGIHMLRRGSTKHPNVLPALDPSKAVKNFSTVSNDISRSPNFKSKFIQQKQKLTLRKID